MSWKLSSKEEVVVFLIVFLIARSWCMTDSHRRCIETFNQDFNNDNLIGTWHNVMSFTLFQNSIPTTECPTSVFTRVNSTELQRYKEMYFNQNIPYSFEDNPLHQDSGDFHREGLLIGNEQAKFFIWNPSSGFGTPEYDVTVYQRIDDKYILMHDCNIGFTRWLMSRMRNPPAAELEAIHNTHPDLARTVSKRFCA